MSDAAAGAQIPEDAALSRAGSVLAVMRSALNLGPRFRDRRFWAVQVLVLLIAGSHTSLEVLRHLGHPVVVGSSPAVSLLSFIPVSLFFIPVVYAALNFGFAGAVATAAWCTVLTFPNIGLHAGVERVREAVQMGIVDMLAIFVGQRVEREVAARSQAEVARAALQVSESKYRNLFESSPVAVFVVSQNGIVRDANPAAATLFGRAQEKLQGSSLEDLMGAGALARLQAEPPDLREPNELVVRRPDGSERFVQPAVTMIHRGGDVPDLQVLLLDMTEEEQRRAGLRAFAARILQAQEEERKRVAQELHDETIQTLILLCRRLDSIMGPEEALPPRATARILEARRSAEQTVAGLRDFARMLRPPTLEDLGLVTSIWRLLTDLGERTEIVGKLVVDGQERRLPGDWELGMFRIAQEALRNVERHAQARHVNVTLRFGERVVALEVADDGKGFKQPTPAGDFAVRGQLGLLGMRERAQLLNGEVHIESGPGQGTKVVVTVPVATST